MLILRFGLRNKVLSLLVVAAVLAPLAAVIYNAIANLTGGITVTLTNR